MPDQKNTPAHKAETSIGQLSLRYLVIILVIFGLSGFGLFLFVRGEARTFTQHEQLNQQKTLNQYLGHVIGYYSDIVRDLAAQQNVVDMINFDDSEAAALWASRTSALLPQNIGLALVTKEGQVMGNPLQLRLGKRCVDDVRRSLIGETIFQPPVHQEVEALAHFDITHPVTEGGEIIGLVFASFSLGILEESLARLVKSQQYAALLDGEGDLIVEVGNSALQRPGGEAQEYSRVPGSDWRFILRQMAPETRHVFLVLSAVLGAGFVITSLIVLLLIYRLGGAFRHDYRQILWQLTAVRKGHRVKPHASSGLRESSEIMREISGLVTEIDNYQNELKDLSVSDALTGLFNRRGFMEKGRYAMTMAERGVPCTLVLIDLDYFKQINDQHGHAVGDKVLQTLGRTLSAHTRSTDICGRIGGDEFAVILVNHQVDTLGDWYAKLAAGFDKAQRSINGGALEPCSTLSCGAISVVDLSCSLDSVLHYADEALYHSKRQGRGRITVHDQQIMHCDACRQDELPACPD